MSNFKAQVHAATLASELGLRTKLAAVVAFDAGDPIISVGTIGAGAVGAIVRILPQYGEDGSPFEDIVGRQQPVYTTGVAQVCVEAGLSAVAGGWALVVAILGELSKRGLKVELFESGAGNAPSVNEIVDANKKAEFESLLYPLIASNI